MNSITSAWIFPINKNCNKSHDHINCFDNLDKSCIKIENFRADSAFCQKEVFEEVEKRATYFFVRAKRSQYFRDKCDQIQTWKTVTAGFQEVEVGTVDYPFGMDKKDYKVVVSRFKIKDSDKNLFEQSTYTYQGIVTNDGTKSE